MSDVEGIKRKIKSSRKKVISLEPVLLSTGSTLLNLACSNDPFGGLVTGSYYNYTGDSDSGKSFYALTALAEASINPLFDNYRLVLDDPENGALMDKEKFFGKKLVQRLERIVSSSQEAFYYSLDTILEKPSIVVLDSMDSITAEDDREKFDERKKAHSKGKETTGTYGTAKAKVNSSNLNWVVSKLKSTNSILIIISQTRDRIGFGAQYDPKTRSGGRALKFYATAEIWTSTKETIKTKYKSKSKTKTVDVGIISQIKVKKNRSTGRKPTIEVPIYWSTGVDDLGSCVKFLCEWGYWKSSGSSLEAPEFDFEGSSDVLVERIEENGEETKLRTLVGEVWKDIEDKCAVRRKPRY